MIPLTNYDFQWGRSENVIIYPESIQTNATQSKESSVVDQLWMTLIEMEKTRQHNICLTLFMLFESNNETNKPYQ